MTQLITNFLFARIFLNNVMLGHEKNITNF